MTFGEALVHLKDGEKVSRSGWNGKGMYIYLLIFDYAKEDLEPCICMFTAQKKRQPGWLASQPDMLSDDWGLVEEKK